MKTFKIHAQGFDPFEVAEGTKLALGLEQNGVDVSHRCGGQAKCTTCRVSITGEEPPMGETERLSLEEDGVLGQFRLSCQIRVDRDYELEVLMRASVQGWEPGVELEP
ncbi:MAG: 2Fe-2S iron-sulfur cluster-binding protein [Fimbriimonas sp.]|nr:2Fe-2S iron-sulfur cluster-binding protein [Fimbriimonas sp.]